MSTCPSCPLREIPYDEQLSRKAARLERALGAYPRLAGLPVAAVAPSARQLGYRNRARMVVRSPAADPAVLLGFYEEGSRKVVPVAHCQAHHPQLERVLGALRPLLFGDAVLRGFARFVDVRCTAGWGAGGEAAIVTLAGELDAEGDDEVLVERAHALHAALAAHTDDLRVGVHLNIARRADQSVLSGEQRRVAGDAELTFDLDGRRLGVPPQAFFQVNVDQLVAVHRRMRELGASALDRVVDLYCGVGVHGIALVPDDGELFGTDVSQAAIGWASENAQRAGLDAHFSAAPDADAVDWLAENLLGDPGEHGESARAFALVSNPARAGMSPQTVAFVGRARPRTVLYLSCEPRTLARDLDRLVDRGFRVCSIEPFDFMPQTEQVETLVALAYDGAEAVAPNEGEQRAAPEAVVPNEDERRAIGATPSAASERAYRPQNIDQRRFSPGVSGPAGLPDGVDETVWVALVVGETPKHGFLPKANGLADQQRVEIERLRKVEGNSVVRIRAATLDDDRIRQRLRAWNHPALGDPDYGDRHANYLAARHAFLDRIALHCVAARVGEAWRTAPVPGAFLGLMRLPRKVLEDQPR